VPFRHDIILSRSAIYITLNTQKMLQAPLGRGLPVPPLQAQAA
jgi:hypothetical protein